MELLWLLLMWSPLSLHSLAYPIRRLKRTSENNEVLQVSVMPTATVRLSPDKTEPLKNEELNALRKLVSLLQDMVRNFPTRRAQSQVPSQKAPGGMSNIAPSPSVTVWMSLRLNNSGTPRETAALANPRTTSTTPLGNDGSNVTAAIIILSDIVMSGETTPENLQNKSNLAVVVHSDNALPEQPVATETLLVESNKTPSQEDKTFNQLTNGALSNLVESLKSTETSTDHPSNKSPQENNRDRQGQQNKSARKNVLELINVEIKSIANAPPSIKNDPALGYYLKKSESFLKDALQRAGEAEEMLKQEKEQEQKKKEAEEQGSPSPSIQVSISEEAVPLTPASSNSLAKKTEDAQLESGKLTALIKLLYSFSPHLMGYAENPPNK